VLKELSSDGQSVHNKRHDKQPVTNQKPVTGKEKVTDKPFHW
jgi:hypothetical protein